MNDISTVENKLFIWKLLVNNGSFNKLTKIQVDKIYNEYDDIVEIVNNGNKYENTSRTLF